MCAPWDDVEGLFEPGALQVATDSADMQQKLRNILNDSAMAHDMVQRGLKSIRQRHTCAHRAAELLDIYHSLSLGTENSSHPLASDLRGAPSDEKAGKTSPRPGVGPGLVQ